MAAERAADLGWIRQTTSPCNEGWRTARYRNGLQIGVWRDRIMMIYTQSPRFSMRKGIGPGDSLDALRAAYPVERVGRNLYTQDRYFGVRGGSAYFLVHARKVRAVELANGFVPDGSEFEC